MSEQTEKEIEQEKTRQKLGILIDVEKGTAEPVLFQSNRHFYYKLLRVDLIDIREFELEGKFFDAICDDEGLLKEKPLPSMFDENGEPVLVGNLLICRNDPETGFEKELTNEDAQLIMRHVVGVSNPKDGRKWKGIHVGNFNDRPKGEIL